MYATVYIVISNPNVYFLHHIYAFTAAGDSFKVKQKNIPSMFLWFQEFKQMTLELLVPFSTRTYDVMVMMTGFFYILSVSLKVLALIWNFYHFFNFVQPAE